MGAGLGVAAAAQAGLLPLSYAHAAVLVYRCPGPPVLYTDQLTPAQAQERQCAVLADQPVSVGRVRGAGHGSAGTGSGTDSGAAGGAVSGAVSSTAAAGARVSAQEQRHRDAAAREILQAELQREQARLAAARQSQDMQTAARAQADIEAIRRELDRRREVRVESKPAAAR